MSRRVTVSLTLREADYLQALVTEDLSAGTAPVQHVAEGASKKLARATSVAAEIREQSARKAALRPIFRPGATGADQ